MAQFKAMAEGQRGSVSRLGSKISGIHATVNGWNLGIRVVGRHIEGKDVFTVYWTGGSNGRVVEQEIAEVSE